MKTRNANETRRVIVIIGFMGSGKTTVARELARLLRCRAIDLDEVISQRESRSPGEIIEQSGEDEFRRIETETLRQVLNERPDDQECIIALGGGTWIVPGNRKLIAEHEGLVIWLDAPFELCWQRIVASAEARPLAPSRGAAKTLFADRRPVYKLAQIQIVVSESKTAADISADVAAALPH